MPLWALLIPLGAIVLLGAALAIPVGAVLAVACVVALMALTLVLPAFTTSAPGPAYSRGQFRSKPGIDTAGAPHSAIGIAIALLVLLPETWAAVRSARANRLQTSLNLSFGSALVSGRTHVMQCAVHLMIFAAFVFFALVP